MCADDIVWIFLVRVFFSLGREREREREKRRRISSLSKISHSCCSYTTPPRDEVE